MKQRILGVLALLLAAAILAGGYAAIDLFDRFLTPKAVVVRAEKDRDATAVLRLDRGQDFRLYPFDEFDEAKCVPAYESKPYAYYIPMKETYDKKKDWPTPDMYVVSALADRLSYDGTQLCRKESADILSRMQYQTDNQMFYAKDLSLTVINNTGERYPCRLTMAFRTDFYGFFELYYLSLIPEESGQESVSSLPPTDLKAVAQTLNEQYDIFWKLAYTEVVYSPEMEMEIEILNEDMLYDNPFCPVIDALRSEFFESGKELLEAHRECVLYGDEVLFVMQGDNWRLALLYDPGRKTFYGGSFCRMN